ncbi:hypothetical protein BJX68DRAFT_231110 [Aspergillus pseudodeflectus]|uniref:Zn(2)-C6 fungal-type domain-containing protein n=1 Tax=Aspergillus pseudodeflectus TaxID=176178 RepID=A0ABR4KTY2_9EURO
MDSSESPVPIPTPKQKRPSSMACDNCRRRKVRCTRERPCQKCQDVSLVCSYTSIPRRKGPKGHNAHVLNSLRILNVLPAGTTSSTGSYAQQQAFTSMPTLPSSYDMESTTSSSPTPSLTVSHTSGSSADHQTQLGLSPSSPTTTTRRISSTVLGAHVGLFLHHLYPIMPVVDAQAMADCADPDALHPRRYAHLVALSAATHLQLNLDIGEPKPSDDNLISGHDLILEALRALCEYDPLDEPHMDTVLTMFFLFCAYGNLNKPSYAWHYLSQTISYLQILNLDKEAIYAGLSLADAEARRRVFWLVFITERAYALQTGRPVMLRPSIRKPSVLNSETPVLLYGFVSLISLFEQMVPDFYSWNNMESLNGLQESSALNAMYQSISNPPALLAEVSETHQVDYIISQQWLLVCLWNYHMKLYPYRGRDSSTLLPIHIPLMAGRCALACLSSVSMPSVDAHGIGMEQKLYDIGESITQLAPTLLTKRPTKTLSTSETKDLLKSILDVLSRTRGSQSYLFSTLLEKSQDILQASHLPPPPPQLFASSKKVQPHSQSQPEPQPQADAGFLSIEMVADPPEDAGISEPDALAAETAEGGSSSHGFKPFSEQGHGSDLYLQY